jgi:hypothetical protein
MSRWPAEVSLAGPNCIRRSSSKHLYRLRLESWSANKYSHLKPGYGWLEQVEIDLEPRCDDGSLAADSPLRVWYNHLKDATERYNKPIAYQHDTRRLLQSRGFIDIQEKVIRAPLNTWPSDPHQKLLGRWYMVGLTEGLEALSLAPFTRVNRWDAVQHVRPFLKQVREEIVSPKIHAYNNM